VRLTAKNTHVVCMPAGTTKVRPADTDMAVASPAKIEEEEEVVFPFTEERKCVCVEKADFDDIERDNKGSMSKLSAKETQALTHLFKIEDTASINAHRLDDTKLDVILANSDPKNMNTPLTIYATRRGLTKNHTLYIVFRSKCTRFTESTKSMTAETVRSRFNARLDAIEEMSGKNGFPCVRIALILYSETDNMERLQMARDKMAADCDFK